MWIVDIPLREFPSHVLDQAGKGLPVLREPTVDRAPVDAKMLGNPVDRARPGRKQQHDEFRDARGHVRGSVGGVGIEHLPRESRCHGIGVRIDHIEVGAGADDPVEIVTEFQAAAEYAFVD